MIDLALEASLESDEGRPAQFALVFADIAHAEGTEPRFELRLTSGTIRRVAPALPTELGLGIAPFGTRTLASWGFIKRREDAVEVRVTGPGRLVVSFGRTNVAIINGTKCRVLTVGRLSRLIDELSPLVGGATPSTDVSLYFLIRLGVHIRSLRHGGAAVIAPRRDSCIGGHTLGPPLSTLARAYRERVQAHQDNWESPDGPRYALDVLCEDTDDPPALSTVARLCNIDGAAVLTSDLDVVAAGVRLTYPDDDKKVGWEQWEPFTGSWENKENAAALGGMRHQSMALFASANPGTLGVICSQDGEISLVGSQPDRMYIARGVQEVVD